MHQIVGMAILDPLITIQDISNEFDNLSYSTVRRVLLENGIGSYISAKKTLLTNSRKLTRLRYCQSMVNFNSWFSTVFCDESMFCTAYLGSKRVLRLRGTRFDEEFLNLIDFSGRISVSVFGLITSRGFGPLIRIQGRLNSSQYCEILEDCLPFLQEKFPDDNYYWLQDNCPVHTSNESMRFIRLNFHGGYIHHPPYSPDLNPIENIWALVKRDLKFLPKANSEDELFGQIEHIWNLLSVDQCLLFNLYDSMSRRVETCIANQGAYTKY